MALGMSQNDIYGRVDQPFYNNWCSHQGITQNFRTAFKILGYGVEQMTEQMRQSVSGGTLLLVPKCAAGYNTMMVIQDQRCLCYVVELPTNGQRPFEGS
jgi:hypothetical protein